jgi:thymidylate synthase (FAD)
MIKLLDHGFIRLIDSMGSDLSIVRNARQSYDAAWRAGEDKGSDTRLINYLHNNGHNTPFEAVVVTFEVKAPILVFRQWHRHRTQSYNEVSARYTELPEEFYVPEPHLIGTQNAHNKQMRDIITEDEFDALPYEDKADAKHWADEMRKHNAGGFHLYKTMNEAGVPRELSRSVLPVATYSRMFATVNLHNLFGFLRERCHTHAQYEIRVFADTMLKLVEPIAPVAVAAFKASVERTKHIARIEAYVEKSGFSLEVIAMALERGVLE